MLNYLNNTSKPTPEPKKKSHNHSQLTNKLKKNQSSYNDLLHKVTTHKSNKPTNNKSKSKSHGKSNSQRLLTCHSQNKITKPRMYPNEPKKT